MFLFQSTMIGAAAWFLSFASISALCTIVSADGELQLVHVIFRHGERAPSSIENGEMYPKDPYLNYSFHPEGHGGLTNIGKLTMYDFGLYLREKYDRFLGNIYSTDIAMMRTTDSVRTMMSAQLVNAGLWPPSDVQSWNKDLPWMPVPVEYIQGGRDVLMWSHKCSTFINEYNKVFRSNEVQALLEPYKQLFNNLSKHTGLNITTPKQVLSLYQTFEAEAHYNLTLPFWTKDYFPNGEMYNVTLLEYEISNWNTLMRRTFGGPLANEVLTNVRSFVEGSRLKNRRIMMYSGHYTNIVSVLQALGLWYPHVPDFGSAILFELYRNSSTNDYGIQVLYYTGKGGNTITMTIPGCTFVCPLDKFVFLLKDVIPDDVTKQCGKMTNAEDENISDIVQSCGSSSSYILSCSFTVLYLLTFCQILRYT